MCVCFIDYISPDSICSDIYNNIHSDKNKT